jgi:hypothetical protein
MYQANAFSQDTRFVLTNESSILHIRSVPYTE